MEQSMSKHSETRAGKAFLELLRDQPEEYERARLRLQIQSEAFRQVLASIQPLFDEVKTDRDVMLRQLGETLAAHLTQTEHNLSLAGFDPAKWIDPPEDGLAKWERRARIIGKNPSHMTLGEIYEEAMAWVDRQRIQQVIVADKGDDEGLEDRVAIPDEQIAPTAKALAFAQDCVKRTGRRPRWGELEKAAGRSKATLNRDPAFSRKRPREYCADR
jgi:hypothetical protein